MMAKLHFQEPLLHASVSHDPPDIILRSWIAAQLLSIILVLKYYYWLLFIIINLILQTMILFLNSLLNRKLKTAFSLKIHIL